MSRNGGKQPASSAAGRKLDLRTGALEITNAQPRKSSSFVSERDTTHAIDQTQSGQILLVDGRWPPPGESIAMSLNC